MMTLDDILKIRIFLLQFTEEQLRDFVKRHNELDKYDSGLFTAYAEQAQHLLDILYQSDVQHVQIQKRLKEVYSNANI